jgi:hypothetical protein
MLQHPSAHRLHLDYYPGDSEYTVREIILQTYPDLQPDLPSPLLERLDSSDRDMKLLAALQHDKYDTFSETLGSNNPNLWYDEPYNFSLLEISCEMKNRIRFVKLLLVKGADPNIRNRVTGMSLLQTTARSGNLELLEMLLKDNRIDVHVQDSEQRTIFHWWAMVSEKNPNDKERLESCFNHLLDNGFFEYGGFDYQDSSENTPFSIVIDREYIDRIILMLSSCEVSYPDPVHMNHVLESASNSLLEKILDHCFDTNKVPAKSKKLKVTFKFFALVYMMFLLKESHHKDLLKYPVMSVFINLLWKDLKFCFFLNVAFYVIFLLFLTAYILFSDFCNIQNNRGVANNTDGLHSHNESTVTCGMLDERRYNISQSLRYALMVLLGLLFLRVMGQILLYRKDYIKSKENWLELLLIFVTLYSCSGVADSIEGNRHLFAIAILLGWFELVLLLGRLPVLSVQTEMLKKVSLTFLQYMAGYIVLILSFAFSFYILFRENAKANSTVLFANPFISILKTIGMFAGELEGSRLPFDTLPGTSHVIFVLFVLFVAIVLVNLLNGLAVGDTKKVREDAENLSLAARVDLLHHLCAVFVVLPKFMKPELTLNDKSKELELHPNTMKNILSTDRQTLQIYITEKRKRNKKEKTTEHVEDWELFTEKLSTLHLQTEEMRQMLNKILTHLNIPES